MNREEVNTQLAKNPLIINNAMADNYYLPCLVELNIQKLSHINFLNGKAIISATLNLLFFYGKLHPDITGLLVSLAKGKSFNQYKHTPTQSESSVLQQRFHFSERQYMCKLCLHDKEMIYLKEGPNINLEHKESMQLLKFRVKTEMMCDLSSQVLYFPFNTLDLTTSVTVFSMFLNKQQYGFNKNICIHFNCHYSHDPQIYDKGIEYQEYNFASNSRQVSISNRILHEDPFKADLLYIESERSVAGVNEPIFLKPSYHTRFSFAFYRDPGLYLLHIMTRFKFVGLLCLFIFFERTDFSTRIARLALISIILFAILPSIHKETLQKFRILLLQGIIWLEIICIIICLIEAYDHRNINYKVDPYIWSSDPYFLVALTLQVLSVLLYGLIYLKFKIFVEPNFHAEPEQNMKKTSEEYWMFLWLKYQGIATETYDITEKWYNKQCDANIAEEQLRGLNVKSVASHQLVV